MNSLWTCSLIFEREIIIDNIYNFNYTKISIPPNKQKIYK